MTENQIKKYEELSELKGQYEKFIEKDGNVTIVYYSRTLNCSLYANIKDDEFKDLVKTLVKEKLRKLKRFNYD